MKNCKKHISPVVSQFILLLIIVFAVYIIAEPAWGSTLEQKRHQLNEVRKNLRTVKGRLEFSNVQQRDLSHQLNRTQNQIKTLQGDIASLNKSIETSQQDIKRLRSELARIQKRYDERQGQLQKRLREIYLNDDNNSMMVLLGSSNFSDFVNHSNYLSLICQSDQNLVKTLRMEQEAIKYKQNEIHDKYRRMLSHRGQLTQKRNSLESIEKTREQLLERVEQERNYYQQRRVELEGHTQELENEIQAMIRQYQRSRRQSQGRSYAPAQSTGSYVWPCPGPITSDYGYRRHPIFGTWRMHTGIDIGAGYGTSIKAVDGGTVILSGWCGGYGNTVIIDHGKGVSTLYAHASRLYVSKGETVSKGQVVAAVGSTGYSTGPHLHFEFRQNGVPVNPWGFLR